MRKTTSAGAIEKEVEPVYAGCNTSVTESMDAMPYQKTLYRLAAENPGDLNGKRFQAEFQRRDII